MGEQMKVAHFTAWAPRRSGMFESVKDYVKYERRAGIDSVLCDPSKENPGDHLVDDGWYSPVSWEEAADAHVFVLHRSIPEYHQKLWDKRVMIANLHGPTEHCLFTEWMTGRKEQSFLGHIHIMWKYDATVVIYQHEYDIMRNYDEKNRLYYIPNSIDLERHANRDDDHVWQYWHRPAIGSFDTNRIEKLPMHIVWAMPIINDMLPDARLNLFGMNLEPIATFRNIFCMSKGRRLESLCENIQLVNNDLRPFQRGVDMVFNNNMSGIYSRSQMESMAMGKPIVSFGGDYTKYKCYWGDVEDIAKQVALCWTDLTAPNSTLRERTIKYAYDNFDRGKEVNKYIKLYKDLCQKKLGLDFPDLKVETKSLAKLDHMEKQFENLMQPDPSEEKVE